MKRLYSLLICILFYAINVNLNAQCWCAFLNNFTAQQQTDKKVKIHWETDSESSTAKDFIVQRAYSPFTVFTDIGYVSANPGASSKSYDFYDANPCSGGSGNPHYRLKSVNIDNLTRFSNEISATLNGCPQNCNNPACQCSLNSLIGPNTVCSGFDIFEVVNASGPVTWSVSDPNIASLQTITSSKVRLTKTGDGSVILTASIPNCSSLTKTVLLGAPQPTGLWHYELACIGGSEFYYRVVATPNVSNTSYIWTITSPNFGVNTYTTSSNEYYGFESPGDNNTVIAVKVKTQNACGTSINSFTYSFSPTICGGGWRIITYPNPAADVINIEIKGEYNLTLKNRMIKNQNIEIILYDANNNLLRIIKAPASKKMVTLNTSNLKPGRYTLVVSKNGEKKSSLVLIK